MSKRRSDLGDMVEAVMVGQAMMKRGVRWALAALAMAGLTACATKDAEVLETGAVAAVEAAAEAVVAAATPSSADFTPDADIFICPRMTVSNRPPTDDNRKVLTYRPFVDVDGVQIAVAPQNGACLSSAFGPRGSRGKLHKGLDYHARPAVMIHAAAAGVIVEAHYRDDYGNQVVVKHSDTVYTRYAHLVAFEPGVKEGAEIGFGTPLGIMGSTAAWRLPVHLHYEILTGDYDTPKKSFGLEAQNAFALLAKGR